jgi:hypothetical protein
LGALFPTVASVFIFIKTDPSPSMLITFLSTDKDKPNPIEDANPILPSM